MTGEEKPQELTAGGQADREYEEAVRELNARVHRHMGITAAVLGLAAAGVALWRFATVWGVSPWEALGGTMPLFLIVLVILGAGVALSLGTARLARLIESLSKRKK